MSEGFPCFNSWGVEKASCYVSSFLSFSLCIINPMLSMNFKQRVLRFDAGERDGWWRGLKHPHELRAQHTRAFWEETSNLSWSLMQFWILWKKKFKTHYLKLLKDVCMQQCSLCLPVMQIRTIPALSFHLPVRKELEAKRLIKLLCSVSHYSHTAELSSSPPVAPNKYQRQIRAAFCSSLLLIQVQREALSPSIRLL